MGDSIKQNIKKAGYEYLLAYKITVPIYDLTMEFVRKYIPYKSRTADQMEQAARSGKQNIVEGVSAGETSKSSEIKLLGVANASFEELLMDFEDYLRQNSLEIYPKTDPKVTALRQTAFRLSHLSNLSTLGYLIEKAQLIGNPQDDANFLLTLCHQVTFLLDKQIKASKEKFIKEGGFRENLFKKRLDYKKRLEYRKS